jgi:transposase
MSCLENAPLVRESLGRPRKLNEDQRQKALPRLANGDTLVDVARPFGVDPMTIGRLQARQ